MVDSQAAGRINLSKLKANLWPEINVYLYDDFHKHCALVYLRAEHDPEFQAILNCMLLEHFLVLYYLTFA